MSAENPALALNRALMAGNVRAVMEIPRGTIGVATFLAIIATHELSDKDSHKGGLERVERSRIALMNLYIREHKDKDDRLDGIRREIPELAKGWGLEANKMRDLLKVQGTVNDINKRIITALEGAHCAMLFRERLDQAGDRDYVKARSDVGKAYGTHENKYQQGADKNRRDVIRQKITRFAGVEHLAEGLIVASREYFKRETVPHIRHLMEDPGWLPAAIAWAEHRLTIEFAEMELFNRWPGAFDMVGPKFDPSKVIHVRLEPHRLDSFINETA